MDVARHKANVRVHCYCGNVSVVDGGLLFRYFMVRRWDTRLIVARHHLKCTQCGASPEFVGVTGQRATAPNRFPASEFEWEQLVKRLRG